MEQFPLPPWPAGTPAETKLADFITTFVRRVRSGPDGTWHSKLMMREMANPTAACAELVQSSIRPQFEILLKILRELLPADVSQEQLRLTAFSIVGQCLFYHFADPVIRNLLSADDYSALDDRPIGAAHHRLFAGGHCDVETTIARIAHRSRAMSWIALKMLTGNRGKYLGIILGIAFASLLIAQQASIFCGLMLQTSGQIRDIQGADIWVMDPNVQFSDDVKPLSENDLYRVRGVTGVSWAVRLYKGLTRSRLEDGNFQQTILLGLDDATLVGAPPK